ncbi:MAG: CmlA/FloR family chloramphenicol efflux MFS transporter [Kofleriaceae bacterium]|nr:CmlA/FloR family chloramphenicol efflux MFS transporter [Kofleriaceae bacterium]
MSNTRPIWGYALPSALLLMAPFDVLASLAMDIYLPVVPAMPDALHTTPSIIQLTLSLYMVVLGVGQIVFGPISDRIGRRPVLLAGAILFAAASAGAAVSSAALPFVGLRLVQAIGASAMLVATFATVRDVYADRPDGTVIYGLFSSILAFVPALGPIAGALLARTFGWRAIFLALAVLATPAIVHAALRWPETRPTSPKARKSVLPIFGSLAFWIYTLAFAAAMGTFFVFFSTAPRVLVGRAGYSELEFSVAFASVALVMVAVTRFARVFVGRWGVAGSAARGMGLLLCGVALLVVGEVLEAPAFVGFIVPMWVMAIGIVLTVSVTANGALGKFGDIAGSAVAFYFCTQSLIVGLLGTLAVTMLPADSAWPLIGYSAAMAALVLIGLALLRTPSVANST